MLENVAQNMYYQDDRTPPHSTRHMAQFTMNILLEHGMVTPDFLIDYQDLQLENSFQSDFLKRNSLYWIIAYRVG